MSICLTEYGSSGQAHGLRGEINMFFDTDKDLPAAGDFLFADIDATKIPYEIETIRRRADGHYLVKFCDVDSSEDAEKLRNRTFYIESDGLEPDDEHAGEEGFYASDLIGFVVTDTDNGDRLGTVTDFNDNTINVLLVVDRGDGRQLLIPFVDEYITDIDPESRHIGVSLPDGFLDMT